MPVPTFTVRYSYRARSVEVLVPPGCRGTGPRPAAVGVTDLGGAAEGCCSTDGTGPPRASLEDWIGPMVGPSSESRVQVALIRVAAALPGAVPGRTHWAARATLSGAMSRQLSESNLRGLRGLALWGKCSTGDAVAALGGRSGQTACTRTPSLVSR